LDEEKGFFDNDVDVTVEGVDEEIEEAETEEEDNIGLPFADVEFERLHSSVKFIVDGEEFKNLFSLMLKGTSYGFLDSNLNKSISCNCLFSKPFVRNLK